MNRSFTAPVMTLIASLVLWSIGQWIYFQKAVNTLEAQSSQVTSQALGRVIEHAHRMNDDLTLQAALQGLVQAPGVIYACVLDNDNKVLAHTEPAQLGQSFENIAHRMTRQRLGAQILRNATTPWGKFVLSLSQRSVKVATSQHTWILLVGNSLVVVSLMWLLKRWNRMNLQDKENTEALDFRCKELSRTVDQLTQSQEKSKLLWTSWMQSSLEQISKPVMLLDHTQRLLACNEAARLRLGISAAESFQGRSWQDIPALTNSGETLQISLEHPGQRINAKDSQVLLEFLSETACDNTSTWIFFN